MYSTLYITRTSQLQSKFQSSRFELKSRPKKMSQSVKVDLPKRTKEKMRILLSSSTRSVGRSNVRNVKSVRSTRSTRSQSSRTRRLMRRMFHLKLPSRPMIMMQLLQIFQTFQVFRLSNSAKKCLKVSSTIRNDEESLMMVRSERRIRGRKRMIMIRLT